MLPLGNYVIHKIPAFFSAPQFDLYGNFYLPAKISTEFQDRIPKRQHIRPISVIGFIPCLPSQSPVRGQILAFWSVILGKVGRKPEIRQQLATFFHAARRL